MNINPIIILILTILLIGWIIFFILRNYGNIENFTSVENKLVENNADNSVKYFKIHTKFGKYLDVNDKNEVIVSKDSNEISQHWSYFSNGSIVNRLNNLCLTIYNNLNINGAKINLNQFKNEQGQMWTIDTSGTIRSSLNNGYLSNSINTSNVFIQINPSPLSITNWKFKFITNVKNISMFNILGHVKSTIKCSGKIEDHPDFYKYMLKTDCNNPNCLAPIDIYS